MGICIAVTIGTTTVEFNCGYSASSLFGWFEENIKPEINLYTTCVRWGRGEINDSDFINTILMYNTEVLALTKSHIRLNFNQYLHQCDGEVSKQRCLYELLWDGEYLLLPVDTKIYQERYGELVKVAQALVNPGATRYFDC